MHALLRFSIITLILVGSVGVALLLRFSSEPAPKRAVETTAVLVDTVPVERINANFTVRSQGTVRPLTETILSAEVSGTVVELADQFVAGGLFNAGDVLLRIDPTNYRVAVDQADALVKQRQIEYDGAKKLRSSGLRAESEYASAAAQLATARAELTRARRDLERTAIRLPYDGMVRSKAVDIGQFVTPGSRLGVTFATEAAEVRLPLTDADLAFVALPDIGSTGETGPAVTLSAERRGQLAEWKARIVRTEGVVDETSRVSYAVARVVDPYALRRVGEVLPMGTFVRAEIEGQSEQDILRVPRRALRGSDQLMLMEEGGLLRIRTVDVRRTNADWAYIADGVSEGERVITTVLESPVNGMLVRSAEPVEEAAASTGQTVDDTGS